MKKINIVRWFLSSCIILLTIILIVQINGLQTRYSTVSVRLNSEVTKKALCEDIKKENEAKSCKLIDLTAFSQSESVIEEKEMGRKKNLTTYCIYGNVEDVLPLSLVSGNLLIREDTYGCVLTKKAAFELFGTIDVIGLQVKINQGTYTIRGVIKAHTEAVLYEASHDTDTFDSLEFTIDDGNGESYADLFVRLYFLNPDYIIGGNYLVRALKNVCLFPFFVVIFDVMIGLILKAKKQKRSKGIRYLIIGVGIAAIVLVCKKLGYYPDRWIPSKWSDFEHFSNISADIKSQLHILSFAKPIAKETALRNDLWKMICLFIATMAGQIYLIRCINEWGNGIADKMFQCNTTVHQALRHKFSTLAQRIREKKHKAEENEEEQQNTEESEEQKKNVEENEEIDK